MDKPSEVLLFQSDLEKSINSSRDVQRRLVLEERRLDVLMKIVGFDVTSFDLYFIRLLDKARRLGISWRLWLAPRGFGKSTALTITDSIHQALLYPNLRLMIASRTKDQASGILQGIKGRLKVEHFCDLFGDLEGLKWGEREVTLNHRTVEYPEPTFYAVGSDGAVASKHFDMIKADDLVDEKNARTQCEREKIHVFVYKVMVPTLMIKRENGESGEFDAVGTRYHPEDIYNHFETKDPNFAHATFKVPALIDPETGEADPEGISSCEERAPTDLLRNRRIAMGSAHFDSQMQQSTKRMQGDIFKDDYFRHYDEDPKSLVRRLELTVWGACDLAIGEREQDDEYADAIVGIEFRHNITNIYTLAVYHGTIPYSGQIARAKLLFEEWPEMRRFGIEANAFQKSRLGAVYRELGAEIGDKCVPILTHKDKVTRAWQLTARYENGRVFHRRTLDSDLEDQLVEFPNGSNDDIFDAVDLAITLGTKIGARKRRKNEPGLMGVKRKAQAL